MLDDYDTLMEIEKGMMDHPDNEAQDLNERDAELCYNRFGAYVNAHFPNRERTPTLADDLMREFLHFRIKQQVEDGVKGSLVEGKIETIHYETYDAGSGLVAVTYKD